MDGFENGRDLQFDTLDCESSEREFDFFIHVGEPKGTKTDPHGNGGDGSRDSSRMRFIHHISGCLKSPESGFPIP